MQHYGGEDPWDKYLSDLAALPYELSVLGINDYWFLDGFERVHDEWKSGRLPNIHQLFPVVEMRTQELAGASDRLRRINVHAIFAEDLNLEMIRQQFLNGIVTSMRLSPDIAENVHDWAGHVSRETLKHLGRQIRESVPKSEAAKYPSSDLQVGFDNLVVSWDEIDRRLNLPYFKGSVLTATGKTEWEAMPWGSGSIGLKKHIINRVDLLFTAAVDADAYHRGRDALRKAKVLDLLLDCSDAHHYADSEEKDRLGNCLTWINADPTFAGLMHAVQEFNDRVFIGAEPPRIRAIRTDPGSVMQSVRIDALTDSASPVYFDDVRVELNPGFTAIIGNKGQGKSALVDVIGLLGNSRNEDSFSFLHEKRFRNPRRNSAATHEAELRWRDQRSADVQLDEHTQEDAPEYVTYLPQSLIDEICSDEPGVAADRFRRELEAVVFSHIETVDRLEASSLSELLAYKTRALRERLDQRRAELGQVNRDIARLRRLATSTRRRALRGELKQLEERKSSWEQEEPEIAALPDDTDEGVLEAAQAKLNGAESRLEALDAEVSEAKSSRALLAARHEEAMQFVTSLETLRGEVERFNETYENLLEQLGLSPDTTVRLVVNQDAIDAAVEALEEERGEISEELDAEREGSLAQRRQVLLAEVEELEAELSAPDRAHARTLAAHREWKEVLETIRGETEGERGLKQVKADLVEIDGASDEYVRLATRRDSIARAIHDGLLAIVALYEDVYEPAVDFIESHDVARAAGLEFAAELRFGSFREKFWDIVGRNMAGPFQGRDQGDATLTEWMSAVDVNSQDSLLEFLERIETGLHGDQNLGDDPDRLIRKGRDLEELYDLIFGLSYLEPYFQLTYHGVPIDELSPGEKGTLLLVFYLLVDRGSRPLLLDQPDENLDSQTVHKVLVPAIKEAKTRRQVIVVTHSPNVAVVADADQVVVARRDDRTFTYRSGAIEDPAINQVVVDVLEGTWPAFRNRDSKYRKLNPSTGTE